MILCLGGGVVKLGRSVSYADLVRYLIPDTVFDFCGSFYVPGSLVVYPKIEGIPCLRPSGSVVVSAFERTTVLLNRPVAPT